MTDTILGLDLGTSGLRACVVREGQRLAGAQASIKTQHPHVWSAALDEVMSALQPHLAEVRAIVADATSSTVMLWDDGPCSPVRMYNDRGNARVAAWLRDRLPEDSGAHGTTSTLVKVLQLKARASQPGKLRIAHQIDWLNAQFLGYLPATDWNNALKLGFDPVRLDWPTAVRALIHPLPVPKVVTPGTPLGSVSPDAMQRWGLSPEARVHAGTTDSIAAFLATGAHRPGDAVTSLGSTLALKLLSKQPIFSSQYGVYSHRLPFGWLAGGASNSGGRVLLKYFSLDEIKMLTNRLDPEKPTGLDYYPLLAPGERFPVNDNSLMPKVDPVPEDRAYFLQGLLEGLVNIERLGFDRLIELGATPPRRIFCAGGGCANMAWQALRARYLPAPLAEATSGEAAFGVTRLLGHADLAPCPH